MNLMFPKTKALPKCKSKSDCVELAKKIIRARMGICECCGQIGTALFPLDGAHVVPVRHSWTAADLRNLLCLRRDCHSYFTAHPLEFEEFVEAKWPGRLMEMRELARQRGKPDWDVVFEVLKAEKKKGAQ